MRALVTGATGFLGVHVARALAEVATVGGAARRPGVSLDGVADVDVRAVDLAERGAATQLVRALAPRAVVHCAALANAGACERDPALARRVNTAATVELAAACVAIGARLVFVSTDLVFGATPPPPGGFDEAHATGPVSVYGASKRDAEERALAVDPGAVVARLPLLYGDSFGRGLGATDALHAALARGETPTLFDDEFRTPLDVADAARALAELATTADPPRGVLHLAGPDRLSRWDLGMLALAARGLAPDDARSRVRRAPRAAPDLSPPRPADCSLDATRARASLRAALRSPREVLRPA